MLLPLLFSCKKEDDRFPLGKLEEVDKYHLDIKETSGLAFGPDRKTLLTVSDNTGQIYEMDLQGNVLRTLAYKGGDLEGVAYNSEENMVAVVEERKREVVLVDYDSGQEISRYPVDVEANDDNKGPEGISWTGEGNSYYMVNEKNPSVLLLWDREKGIVESRYLDLGSDNSGIFVSVEDGGLWILSDEGESVYQCDGEGNVLKRYDVGINKPEGIVVDTEKKRMYVVRDLFSKLFVFDIVM